MSAIALSFDRATWMKAASKHVLPRWTVVVFTAAVLVAYSPNVLQVFGIHNDYEMLYYKSSGFFHPEAEHLFSIGRPIAALLTNLTMLPIHSLSDYRWTRLFSIATVVVCGSMMMAICVRRLSVGVLDAVAIALATFSVPAFTYSILNASAWTPHLLTILIVLCSYALLARSNLQALPFLLLVERRNWAALGRQSVAYCASRSVIEAGLVYQMALYDYPPNALLLAVFPVIGILFSHGPRAYRTLVALRDFAFLTVNLLVYALSAKLLYLPFVRLFTSLNTDAPADNAFVARLAASYKFQLTVDPFEMLGRLWHLLKVAGDVWFLPQSNFHVIAGLVVISAIVLAYATVPRNGRRAERLRGERSPASSTPNALLHGALAAIVVAAGFVISGAAVLAAGGGFVSYRTIAVATALAAIVVLWSLRFGVEATCRLAGKARLAPAAADSTIALTACIAISACTYSNFITMKLARNEYRYFEQIVQRAADSNSKAIFLIDPRPFTLPEENPIIYDQKGRWIPPYELGCFSGYCLQTGAILAVAANELGYGNRKFTILPTRGDSPMPGLTCAMLTGRVPSFPAGANARERDIVNYYRSLSPLTCVTYDLAWHDLAVDLSVQ